MGRLLPAVLVLALSAGCACTSREQKTPRALPEPADFRVTGTLTANLTPQLMAETGLPQRIKGSLEASAHSVAISAEPLRSRHEGHMKLTLTDGDGKQSLANVEINVSGDSDGSPSEGLGQAIRRFLDAASMMTRPIPQAGGPVRDQRRRHGTQRRRGLLHNPPNATDRSRGYSFRRPKVAGARLRPLIGITLFGGSA